MADAFLILSEPLAAPHLVRYVSDRAGARPVRSAVDRSSLTMAVRELPRGLRLIAFCSSTIVPTSIIESLPLMPYNIHPGSPDFPGVHPDAFAHACGARTYGATAHELTGKIDGGVIVATALTQMPKTATRDDYSDVGFLRALDLFRFVAGYVLDHDTALPPLLGERWNGQYNTLAEYKARFGDAPAPGLSTSSAL